MNYYHCSDGSRISKAQIDRNVKQAKENVLRNQLNTYGFNFCQDCRELGIPKNADQMELLILDCSHNQSVDWCQKNGCAELAWDKDNIRIRCRAHHRIWDKTNLQYKVKTI
jgi:hypothetical protein